MRPTPERMALLDRVLPRLDELRERAATWLDGFVDRRRFATQGQGWELVVLSSAPRDAAGTSQDTLHLVLEGDPYGEWAVTVQELGARFLLAALTRGRPSYFRRKTPDTAADQNPSIRRSCAVTPS
jgi:hypothetical protein